MGRGRVHLLAVRGRNGWLWRRRRHRRYLSAMPVPAAP
jgi:hypothetical protein